MTIYWRYFVFFPNQPNEIINEERKIRKAASSLEERARINLYKKFSLSHPSLKATDFILEKTKTIIIQNNTQIYFPRPLPLIKFSHIIFGYEEWLTRKYTLPGFLEIEPEDIAVDCGTYVGGFSLGAAKVAKELHIFEPDISNFDCILKNMKFFNNVKLNNLGLYNVSKEINFNISDSSVEHSILKPDNGKILDVRKIKVKSLKDYAEENSIKKYDFLKIEAEGVELEVFEGLKDLLPQKIAVDVSPERNGKSPINEFKLILDKKYHLRQRGHVLFAKLK